MRIPIFVRFIEWNRTSRWKLSLIAGLFALLLFAMAQSVEMSRLQSEESGERRPEALSDAFRSVVLGGADVTIFFKESCASCREAKPWIDRALKAHPDLLAARIDMEEDILGSSRLRQTYLNAYRIPFYAPQSLPLLFIGDELVSGPDAIRRDLPRAVARYESGHSPPPAIDGIRDPVSDLRLLALIRSAFAASVSPASWMTLVFLALLLTLSDGSRRSKSLIGAAFVFAALVANAAILSGALRSFYAQDSLLSLGRILYPATALASLALGWLWLPRRATGRFALSASSLAAFGAGLSILLALLGFAFSRQISISTLLYAAKASPGATYSFDLLICDLFRFASIGIVALAASFVPWRIAPDHGRARLALSAGFALLTLYLAQASCHLYSL